MSLINDALKRANQTKPPVVSDPAATPLRIVEPPQEPARPPKWLLFAFPTALLLVCGIAGILIFQGWKGSDDSLPELGGITASARGSEPEPESTPIHPSNDWVSVAGAAATNGSNTATAAFSEPTFPELRLQGVFYRPSNPSAVINAKTVYKGDKVETARVIAIGKDTVTVEWKGQRKVLTME